LVAPTPLRVVFAGTPAFAEHALEAILASAHPVVGVLTQPDRPAGRGQKPAASPVKLRAQAAGVPVLQPPGFRDPASLQVLQALRPDVLVVAAYGLILPQAVLDIPPLGCLNIHASLLPRWRGAAPIVRAIQAGDRESGVCIMRMESGLDTGPVAITRTTPIAPDDTAGSLHDRLARMGAEAIVETLDSLVGVGAHNSLQFVSQPDRGVTYARKVEKAEARIDWGRDAAGIANSIRAFDPVPGATTALTRQPELPIRLFMPAVIGGTTAASMPGEIVAVTPRGLLVATGNGILGVSQLQRAGGRRLAVSDFLRGHPIQAGERWLS